MPYKFKCSSCQEFIYLERVSDEDSNYSCPGCQSRYRINSSWHRLQKVNNEEFDNKKQEEFDNKKQNEEIELKKQNKNTTKSSIHVNKYPVLKTISGLYDILAILSIIIGVIGFFFNSELNIFIRLMSIVSGGIGYVVCKLISEEIILSLDIANDIREIKEHILDNV